MYQVKEMNDRATRMQAPLDIFVSMIVGGLIGWTQRTLEETMHVPTGLSTEYTYIRLGTGNYFIPHPLPSDYI